jgi:hypothetical protein
LTELHDRKIADFTDFDKIFQLSQAARFSNLANFNQIFLCFILYLDLTFKLDIVGRPSMLPAGLIRFNNLTRENCDSRTLNKLVYVCSRTRNYTAAHLGVLLPTITVLLCDHLLSDERNISYK